MEDWCKRCVYAEIDGADDPCFECEWGNDEAPTRFTAKRKKLTNADKYFRNATDEELAEWIAKHMYCEECMFFNDENGTCNYDQRYGKGCNGAMLEWLKQEVESDELQLVQMDRIVRRATLPGRLRCLR